MLKGLLLGAVGFVAGYVVGAIFGFRAAVTDYVENDAEQIDALAESIYGGGEDGDEAPPEIQKLINQANGDEADGSDGRAFQ
jgi:hypothetical protein